LFVRSKAGTDLTAAGRRFQRHATTLVRTVEQARHEVGAPKGVIAALAVGGRIGLWEAFLLHWLPLMRKRNPRVSIRAESGLEPELMEGLIDGRIDIGVMYTPQSRPGLEVEQLFVERLVMISTRPNSRPAPGRDYVYVDWGPEFYARHRVFFPDFGGPLLSANIGLLGLQHILGSGGSGYFPLRMSLPHIEAGRLHRVDGAPEFLLPAYVVYPRGRDDKVMKSALALLRQLVR
jgi:DNA-binding transcriptional LysR family regulator